MGCDIHAYAEVNLNNKWTYYGKVHIDRNYFVFGKMAGVRGESIEPISLPKGFPGDVSELTKMEAGIWRHDMHSASWLNIKELIELKNSLCSEDGGLWSDDSLRRLFWSTVFEYLTGEEAEYPECRNVTDLRLVFWFDN